MIERKGKLGLGTAYITGFKWALEHAYEYIFEMDADFSHNPNDLPRLYQACSGTRRRCIHRFPLCQRSECSELADGTGIDVTTLPLNMCGLSPEYLYMTPLPDCLLPPPGVGNNRFRSYSLQRICLSD